MGLTALRDVTGGVFTLAWVPFLGCFTLLLFGQDDGPMLVLLAILVPVANDIGGYVAGVLFGSHPMAPGISPKKSWERSEERRVGKECRYGYVKQDEVDRSE